MKVKIIALLILFVGILACDDYTNTPPATYPDIKIVGAMKNVMWKGELGSIINLDTIADKKGLYGVGPLSYLRGELLIKNGVSYVSKVNPDSTISMEKNYDVSAPFFVYTKVNKWREYELPDSVKTMKDLETYIDTQTSHFKRPFAFKLAGHVAHAVFHIQNLPEGSTVSSPAEAHHGQVKYEVQEEDAEIIGFFSTEHQGIFTHHDSFLHMHLITLDESKMGHLDELEIGKMKLYLPEG